MIADKYLSDFVYGSIDGIITTFAIVTGTMGAKLHHNIILILGISNVLADGFSMAVSRYLSAEVEEEMEKIARDPSPLFSAIVTFLAFVAMGMIPLLAFVIGYITQTKTGLYRWTFILTALALYLVGYLKGHIGDSILSDSGTETLLIGGAAAFISYYVGKYLQFLRPGL